MANKLYEQDLQKWIEKTIDSLKKREFESLDIEHLIEELVDLGKSEKNTLKSNLMILLAHLLKLQVQSNAPESMKGSWYNSVLEYHQRVLNNLADTPSLKSFLPEAMEKSYKDARKLAISRENWLGLGSECPMRKSIPWFVLFPLSRS
ncbi:MULTISPECIES: DUF29 domain-containing protein [unclassified Synechocystis]|uniref:DUF29 domain-containing protein n=1 Tax=unclassified Synechocystis TaxID=2640012 RepID=UPI0004016C00|nr:MULTISPECIES: DUF29 domain-containing protein [unclassified Synechocystis]AIE74898.1 hypothetical protein D082_23700 [Synechocystis sp. PCC 6714]MCT0253387.1 DUF29 domain-containing protein [Synechocystis sp. CS-94]